MSADATPLHRSGPFDVRVLPAGDDAPCVWVGVVATPTRDEIERLCAVLVGWFRGAEAPAVLHVEHTSGRGEVAPPDLPSILLVVSTLLEHRETVDRGLLGTCVQVTHLDDVARTARDVFLSLYQPQKPLAIVDAADDAARFRARCARKRDRAAAGGR